MAEFRKSVKIPQSVFYKTLSHARSESAAALHPRSRAPKQPATRYGSDVVNELSGSASSTRATAGITGLPARSTTKARRPSRSRRENSVDAKRVLERAISVCGASQELLSESSSAFVDV